MVARQCSSLAPLHGWEAKSVSTTCTVRENIDALNDAGAKGREVRHCTEQDRLP
jgi:hypothetical protein